MNLIHDPWIPVRDAGGCSFLIAPHEITRDISSNPILRLDAPRPDFNGALVQFLVGLIQTAWVRNGKRWRLERMLHEPPSPAELADVFAPMASAFDFDGAGPRFMQDPTLCDADKPAINPISALLMDAPGEQAIKFNSDHFVKRGTVGSICEACAAAALFTLMTNAPSGGAGHRTSLRGGGPLTTLLLWHPSRHDDPSPALWRDLAANVREPRKFMSSANPEKADPKWVFPWLTPLAALQPREETQPLDVHPAQVFWAMPRRIRLNFETTVTGCCDLCGAESTRLLTEYQTKNYGLNYKGPWRHPLSPYYRTKPADPPLPMHPQPGGMGYRHWLGWVLGTSRSGRSIEPASVLQDLIADLPSEPFNLWAFGYDMDNMKARCWYEARFPLFNLPNDAEAQEQLRGILDRCLEAADLAVFFVRKAIRDVWFGDGESRGDLSFIDASFWTGTEATFFECVREAARLAGSAPEQAFENSLKLREQWVSKLGSVGLNLFDSHAASADAEASRPERLARAHRVLVSQLRYGDKLRRAAGLPVEARPAGKRSAKR